MTGVLLRKGENTGRRRQSGVMLPQLGHQELEEVLSQCVQREPGRATPGFWTSGVHNYESINFCCVSCPFVTAA